MKFKQKITKIGNSLGIVLPKKLTDSQGIELGMEINLTEVQDKVIFSKNDYSSVSPEVLRIAEKVADEYGDVFEELAKK